MYNFWQKLKKPFYALAPMAGVTDMAFRQICQGFGVDVLYSEMASATALTMKSEKTLDLLKFDESERPYVVQLFGSDPKHFALATEIITKKIKPDGIDINFGCPVPKIVKQGAGIALFKDLKRSKEVIKATIEATDLPVSIKTRSRVGEVDVFKFLENINGMDLKAIMIHGRTGTQGFTGPVDTEIIKNTRKLFNGVIMANGGVYNYKDAQKLLDQSEADGIGIAQGALGRPWIFKAVRTGQSVERSSRAVKKVALEHLDLAFKYMGEQGIIEMRKHLAWYVKGLAGARDLRRQLVLINTIDEAKKVLNSV